MRQPRQQLVEIENGAHLAADVCQRLQGVGVFALAFEQSGVDQRLRDVRGKLPQHDFVALRERAFRSESRFNAPRTLPL